MNIENLDKAIQLGNFRDKLLSMIRHLSKENKQRTLRIQFHDRPDDVWDDTTSDDRLLELVEQSIQMRLREIEQDIENIE